MKCLNGRFTDRSVLVAFGQLVRGKQTFCKYGYIKVQLQCMCLINQLLVTILGMHFVSMDVVFLVLIHALTEKFYACHSGYLIWSNPHSIKYKVVQI